MPETPSTSPEKQKVQTPESREAVLSIMSGKSGTITRENVWFRKEKNGVLIGKDFMKKDAPITILKTATKRNTKGEKREYCLCKFPNTSTKSGQKTGFDTGWIAAAFIRQESPSTEKKVSERKKETPVTTPPSTPETQNEKTPEQLAQQEVNERWKGVSSNFRRFIVDERGDIIPPTDMTVIEDCDVTTLNDRDKAYIYECANMKLLELSHLTHIGDIRLPGELTRVIMPALTDASGIKWGEKITHVSMPALQKGLPVGKGSNNSMREVFVNAQSYQPINPEIPQIYQKGELTNIPTVQLKAGLIVDIDGQPFTGTIDKRSPLSAPRFRYFGDIRNGVIDGVGEQIFENGARYIGSYQNNKFSGSGRYELANGAVYEGLWSDDAPNGDGIYTVNGVEFKGTFVDNVFDCRRGDTGAKYTTTLAELGEISRGVKDERMAATRSKDAYVKL